MVGIPVGTADGIVVGIAVGATLGALEKVGAALPAVGGGAGVQITFTTGRNCIDET